MKILIDAHIFDGKFQGSRTYIKGIYSEMIQIKKDWEFYFVGIEVDNIKNVFGIYENTNYLQFKFKSKYIRLLIELPYLIYKHKIDYSHFQYISPIFKSGKYIVTIHDILFEEKRFRSFFSSKYRLLNSILFKRTAVFADILLTVSEYSRSKISEIYKIKKDTIFITPNAINVTNEDSKKDDYIISKYNCKKFILYVSRIEPRKNHISILRAYLNLKLYNKEYQIVFIGDQDIYDEKLMSFIKENNTFFDKTLHFFSNVSDFDLKKFIVNSDIVVYPSFAEGFGIPPLEAAIYKKKVICSSSTAMAEYIFFKYLIDPYNQNEIEKAISRAINDDDDDNLIEIQKIILDTYNWRNSAQVLIDLIEKNSSMVIS